MTNHDPKHALGAGLPTPPKRSTAGLPISRVLKVGADGRGGPSVGETFGHAFRRGRETRAERGATLADKQPAPPGCLFFVLSLAFSLLLLVGCEDPKLETEYGRCNDSSGGRSINGTAVLGGMFEESGHTVFAWNRLSPRLAARADCIVWFPDDFQPPSRETRVWLEEWLRAEPDRTLIHVGRDFDAEPTYWRKVERLVSEDQLPQVRRRREKAEARFLRRREQIPESRECEWFLVNGEYDPRAVRELQSDFRWTDNVAEASLEIELNSRILRATDAKTLLESRGDTLVTRQSFDSGCLIVVANGSFLLNLPLMNHEHRKLAGKLIEEIGEEERTIAFLESGPGGPEITDEDPPPPPRLGLGLFSTWPTNWILLHLAAVGIIFCFVRYPIFGRPIEPEIESPTDFGGHIRAVAELLRKTGDVSFAISRLKQYQQASDHRADGDG